MAATEMAIDGQEIRTDGNYGPAPESTNILQVSFSLQENACVNEPKFKNHQENYQLEIEFLGTRP